RAPGFTTAAVLILAVGVGGSTAVFSVLRSVVMRPLGFPHPGELVRLYERPAGLDARWPFSGADSVDVSREGGPFASVAGIRAARQTLTGRGPPVQVRVARITANFFSSLQISPAFGHGPAESEDVAGGRRTAVLTDSFWRREFGGDRGVLGRTLTVDGLTYEIGGVLPADFHFPLLRQAEVLVPMAMGKFEAEFRGTNWVTAVARLKPGATVREAQAALDVPWMLSALLSLAPPDLPRLEEIRLDGAVMAFALVASIGAGLLAGLAPALQLTSPQLMDVLKNGSGGTGRWRARTALVVAETGLALVLAVGSGLMIRTLSGLLEVPSGLAAPERGLVADLDLPPSRYPDERIFGLAR